MSERHGQQLRAEACRLAVDAFGREPTDADDMARLMALCVFFDCYISHGSKKTEKWMKLMEPLKKKTAKVFTFIPGGAA